MTTETTTTQKQVRLVLEQQCAELGREIVRKLPAGVEFVFVTFDFGENGNVAYLSSAQRDGAIKMLEELVVKMKAGKS